ncbi:TIGR03087 family PEP-CTERM/XrtA system glycosyltransferase [Thiohalophilus thiocyanatoxydans]|uniref:Sugar transferase (PEP-CTERM/EpsH1 system associated) n=1 Tax=Thiohalophilus thiocyanatoxydans TaxID=381308 RepID=A0A4R8IS40_9GAMM|nr:TIGR03087 family PEP-CTERM/XrtA system glycosyltransferase [Thiohalophilus thiocyanatoxydans]TDY03776.1 sugar transferase (PEP-CTERM/EpsH1 system associated) [Thiohalophilus thiocyanatoxydans]
MKDLLFLAHRIPYPPNKGDKIRSFNMLKHLSTQFRVHLGCFVDDPRDWQYQKDVAAYCESLCLLPLHPGRARVKSLTGLLGSQPLTLPYYRNRRMQQWVNTTLARGVDRALVFSAAMTQYLPANLQQLHTVIDFCDVDSDKWRQYATGHRFPMNWIYAREARTLLAFERRQAAASDAAVFVTEQEARLFRELAPESAARVHAIDNGVDTRYFSPEQVYPNPYPATGTRLVFVGAMDYWANVDAVVWFANQVFPAVRAAQADAEFVIVGARPTPEVTRLARLDGVVVTGAVPDVRPYLAHANLAVAPLRIARGVQNKVLEAMAMGCPVVATPQALDGLRDCPQLNWRVAEQADDLSNLCLAVLKGEDRDGQGARGRDCVLSHYSWSEHMARLIGLLNERVQNEPA